MSNHLVEMPVDHLIKLEDLMPKGLSMQLFKPGSLPLKRLALETIRPDLGYVGVKAPMLFQPDRSKASDPKSLLSSLPALVRISTIVATHKFGNKRKTIHSHLFLPKNYSGDPYTSIFTPHAEAEVLSLLESGWGIGNVEDLQLSFLHGPEDDH